MAADSRNHLGDRVPDPMQSRKQGRPVERGSKSQQIDETILTQGTIWHVDGMLTKGWIAIEDRMDGLPTRIGCFGRRQYLTCAT